MKVLIIDDNSEITDMLSRYLKLENFDVSVSNDGKNGLTLIRNSKFDKIILDLSMPDFSGKDVLESVYKEKLLGSSKLFVLTASTVSTEEESTLLEFGASACVTKPIQMAELVELLKS